MAMSLRQCNLNHTLQASFFLLYLVLFVLDSGKGLKQFTTVGDMSHSTFSFLTCSINFFFLS